MSESNYTPKMIKDLSEYYEGFDKSSVDYIRDNFYIPTLDLCKNIVTRIQETRPRNFGFPDIECLAKFKSLCAVQKNSARFVANVCRTCGSVYDIRMQVCPACFLKGQLEYEHSVKVSALPIEQIRYNIESYGQPADDEGLGNCFVCEHREGSYCEHFGSTTWSCYEFERCPCRKCCVKAKKQNAKLEQRMKGNL